MAKRAELVAAAVTVFGERGYEQTSMEDIRNRAGCSKGTLYSYFSSKDELFLQALLETTEQETSRMAGIAKGDTESTEAFLNRLGASLLKTLYAPRFQSLRRLAFSTPNADVGMAVYLRTVQPYETQLAAVFASLMSDGTLREAEPSVAAHHFVGLLESELFLKFLLRAIDDLSQEQLEATAARAVQVFFTAYKSFR